MNFRTLPGSNAPEISLVIPTYNEEPNVRQIAAAAIAQLESCTDSFEVLFIDNASTDQTVPMIRELCAADPRIRLILNTRNFGQMRSPTHMIYQARGQAVVGLCADFQDPPEMIPEFVRRWRAGADIVLGTRATNHDTLFLRSIRQSAYGFIQRFGDYPVIPNATGFGLYNRRAVEFAAGLDEPEPFFRGMLVESGFRIELIPYERPPRAGGYSKNNLFSLMDFSLSGLAGSAKKLVRVPFFIGFFSWLILIPLMILFTLAAFAFSPWGWVSLGITILEAHLATLFLFLGLIGDQVRLISERTRGTPLVVERERVNFEQPG